MEKQGKTERSKKSVWKIALIVVGVLAAILIILGVVDSVQSRKNANKPSFTDFNKVKNIYSEDDEITYTSGGTYVSMRESDEDKKDKFLADEDNGEYIKGVTKDGTEYEGRGRTIYLNLNNSVIRATNQSTNKLSTPSAAGIASAVLKTPGYVKNKKDWNIGYSVYYIEKANCLLYYPKQFKIKDEGKDKISFADARSQAKLDVYLGANSFSCMDEVEEMLYSDAEGTVLASGTDWYDTLLDVAGEGKTIFNHVGLGNKYSVNCELTYETKYSFAFDDLRSLIKCKFVEDGKWVSNVWAPEKDKKVAALKAQPNIYDPAIKPTSFYFENLSCVAHYPDIFTKAYQDDYGVEYFTDPHTGAYFSVSKVKTDINTLEQLQDTMDIFETELVSDRACKGRGKYDSESMISYCVLMDSNLYKMEMHYPNEYAYVYDGAYDMAYLAVEGEAIDCTEMQDIYFNPFSCNITVPLQFKENGTDGDVHVYKDNFAGLEMRVSFAKITDKKSRENIYEMFDVKAKDKDVIYGEYFVKWHNADGAFIGAISDKYGCLIELPYPNAYNVYEKVWDKFAVTFSDEEEYVTPADEIRKEAAVNYEKQGYGTESDPGDTNEPKKDDASDKSDPGDTKDPKKDDASGKSDPPENIVYETQYDILTKDPGNPYNDLPVADRQDITIDTIVAGDMSIVEFTCDEDVWRDFVLEVGEALCEDFNPLTFGENEYGDFVAHMTGRLDRDFPDVELYFYTYPGRIMVAYYLMEQETAPIKGKLMIDHETFDDYWGTLDSDEDYYLFLRNIEYIETAIDLNYDLMSGYCRLCTTVPTADLLQEDTGDVLFATGREYPCIETGYYSDGEFIRTHLFSATGVGDLVEFSDDGVPDWGDLGIFANNDPLY